MERHSANARAVAASLSQAAGVARVHHPSLAGHPEHELARRLYPRGTGGILAFDLADASEVDRFLRGLELISIVHSLGEVQTTISYPAVSSHRALPPEMRRAFGVSESTLRLSVGIEHADDISADLEHALAGLGQRVRA
jgi:cystathionine beta-lyase/cystathionine gamma-synthase